MMNRRISGWLCGCAFVIGIGAGCSEQSAPSTAPAVTQDSVFVAAPDDQTRSQPETEVLPFGRGPYSVGSTNMEVEPGYADIGDDLMHEYLLGRAGSTENARYIAEILKHPDSAWITEVPVPDERALYGPASAQTLPVVTN